MQVFAPIKEKLSRKATARNIFRLVNDELELVEAEYIRQASSNIQVIDYLGEYLRASGGKRVRPALLLLATYAAGGVGSSENVIRMATVMEMLHTATLVHDDVIDNAEIRRSKASVNARFGDHTAVLMGDWLYMSAFENSLKERSLEILEILTRLTRKMTEGELIQLTTVGRVDITEQVYFDILKRKTAYLFSACCEIGAILGASDTNVQQSLREYGMNLGIAFQLADDLLDFTSDDSTIGKAAGADLIDGKVTLPLIILQQKDDAARTDLEQVVRDRHYNGVSRHSVVERANKHGIVEMVRELAFDYAERARKNLDVLPETEYRLALEAIPRYVVDRIN
ncbi:MAG: polyprenyl synthetase family protein [Pyrinomonadaceae bacterium]